MAAALGCSLGQLSERLTRDELELWLAHYLKKLGFTADKDEIHKMRVEKFLNEARSHWRKIGVMA